MIKLTVYGSAFVFPRCQVIWEWIEQVVSKVTCKCCRRSTLESASYRIAQPGVAELLVGRSRDRSEGVPGLSGTRYRGGTAVLTVQQSRRGQLPKLSVAAGPCTRLQHLQPALNFSSLDTSLPVHVALTDSSPSPLRQRSCGLPSVHIILTGLLKGSQ